MTERSLTTEQILTMLAAGPAHIAALTADLTPAQLRAIPTNGGWSANDALAHLRSCADMWGDCIAVILAEDTPTLRAINPRTWMEQTDYPELEFRPSFHAFTTQRTNLLAVLQPLAPEDWSRAAIVKGAGKALNRTVFFYAQWLATHERSHLKQIQRIVSAIQA